MPYGTEKCGSAEGIGGRIRELRALRDYSLAELSQRAHVSTAMLSYVERGDRLPSESVVASVARALGVGVSVLRGQPFIEQMQRDKIDRLMEPVSIALDDWLVPPGDDDPPPRPFEDLRRAVLETIELRERAELVALTEELPGLLAEVSHSVQMQAPGEMRERLCWLQAELTRGAWRVAYRVGHMNLARLAVARMSAAAAESGDPRQMAVERWMRAQMTFEGARLDLGIRLVNQALRDLPGGDPRTQAVRGSLYLKASILTARQGDGDASDSWLAEARTLAAQTGETRYYELAFGPANVDLHGVAAAGDRSEHGLAIERAQEVHLPENFPKGRAGHFWIDKARAEVWTARNEDALGSLFKAREVAPQQTRYHPQVRETVAALLRARQRTADPLREFAKWSGV